MFSWWTKSKHKSSSIKIEDRFKQLIAQHLNIPVENIVKVEMLSSYSNRFGLLEEIITVYDRAVGLSPLNEIIDGDSLDSLFICSVTVQNVKRYHALIFDPVELYAPTDVLRMIPI